MSHFHQVEVDDEVFEFVKQHAEPLTDTFNSALKRLLKIKDERVSKKIRPIPPGVPQALKQILEVVQYVHYGMNRKKATRLVANKNGIKVQTVFDKYTRQLGLTASHFDVLLTEQNSVRLKELLKKKFSGFEDAIDNFLD